jgi:hypothetical protein
MQHSTQPSSKLRRKPFVKEMGVAPTVLPISRLKVELSKARASLSHVDLPGGALGIQHSDCDEVQRGGLHRNMPSQQTFTDRSSLAIPRPYALRLLKRRHIHQQTHGTTRLHLSVCFVCLGADLTC